MRAHRDCFGRSRVVILFRLTSKFTPKQQLVNVLTEAGQPVPEDLKKFGLYTKRKTHAVYGDHFKDVDMSKKGTKIVFDD